MTTLDEFRDHHAGAASTAELMSLTRARVVCGDPATSDAVTAEIRRALSCSRDPGRLLHDVAARREAIAAEHPSEDSFDLQHVRGGLVDLESLAQYLRLRHAHDSPEVLVGATAACFEALGRACVIPEEEASFLAGAVRMQRTIQAMLRLTWSQGAPIRDAPEPMRRKLATTLECSGLDELDTKLRQTQAAAFEVFQRRIGMTATPIVSPPFGIES